ncbi:MAG: 4-(cytidine 5'-diphospho)-2-C-methyl-D-erythritol kinase [Suilimivivens sp.]
MDCVMRKAYAKINLGLDVIRRRPDGYHEVKMIMQSVGIYDVLSFKKSEKSGIFISLDHAELPCDQDNLIYKAAKLIMDACDIRSGVEITLNKNIPIAAGMAGGSTDAAAVFHGLNELFQLGMSLQEMKEMGVKIGADVPYCIMGGTALSEGIGEILTPIPAPPKAYLLIAKPDINVSTKFVYENLHADTLKEHPDIDGMVDALTKGDLKGITDRMGNVLETVTVREYPIIDRIKGEMLMGGAENALMSGSGPTVFGIFEDKEAAERCSESLREQGFAKQIFVTEFVENGVKAEAREG